MFRLLAFGIRFVLQEKLSVLCKPGLKKITNGALQPCAEKAEEKQEAPKDRESEAALGQSFNWQNFKTVPQAEEMAEEMDNCMVYIYTLQPGVSLFITAKQKRIFLTKIRNTYSFI